MLDQLSILIQQLVIYCIQIFQLVWPIMLLIFAWRAGTLFINRLADVPIDRYQMRQRSKKIGDSSNRAETLHRISTLTPKEFEYYVADILTKNNFVTRVTGGHGKGDGGIDIVGERDGKPIYVQCKKFIGRDIGVAQVREFYGVTADEMHSKDARAYFFTTSYFTEDAIRFAKQKHIYLYNGPELVDLVFAQEAKGNKVDLNGSERSQVLRNTLPICPACNRELKARKGSSADFLGCAGYPQCKYTYTLAR